MKSILDPSFRYTCAAQTDLRKTFARIRREQASAGQSPATVKAVIEVDRVAMANVFRFAGRQR